MEEWRPINFYINYQISSLGNVRNKYGITLNPAINNSGYLYVCLCDKGKIKLKLIHRLVAEAFIDNTESKLEVDHKDRNKLNNNIQTLRWVTRKENLDNRVFKQKFHFKEKYISMKNGGLYVFQIRNKVYKCFKTLDDAIKSRDEFLNENK